MDTRGEGSQEQLQEPTKLRNRVVENNDNSSSGEYSPSPAHIYYACMYISHSNNHRPCNKFTLHTRIACQSCNRHQPAVFFVLSETSLRSPWSRFIFNRNENNYGTKASQKHLTQRKYQNHWHQPVKRFSFFGG